MEDFENISGISFIFTKFIINVVSSSEFKLWHVPRLDSRNIRDVRHPRDFSFPGIKEKDLPLIVLNVKSLWSECFNNDNHQQPTRPISITSTSPVRFLNHSSIKSGWNHLFSTFFQIGKV